MYNVTVDGDFIRLRTSVACTEYWTASSDLAQAIVKPHEVYRHDIGPQIVSRWGLGIVRRTFRIPSGVAQRLTRVCCICEVLGSVIA